MAVAKECGIIPTTGDPETDKFGGRFRCMTGADFRKTVGGLRISK